MTQHHKQPYDSSLKSFLREQTAEILPYLLPNTEYVGELPTDVFKPQPPLRADKLCKVLRNGKPRVLHFELETGATKRMAYRMLSYSALLMEEHEIPVISIIIYPFRTTVPTVTHRYPDLADVAKQTIPKISELAAIRLLTTQISNAADENFVRTLLDMSAA